MKTAAAIFATVIGVAIVAVLVSNKSQTSSVLTSLGSAISNILGAIVKPVASAAPAAANNAVGSANPAGVTAPTVNAAPASVTSPNTGTTGVNT